ncbi:hypothetical protein L1987_16927 [Smallanthus sonchifolius]|uniref:Uncharacterized protein n=1 Tax=Smallanthus sonchifolius TaxID=185202 RepID=A0ACB9IW31_9ASTR|nr:hypothetical protein L1987_16927 [Smallanthus sonchifolius]
MAKPLHAIMALILLLHVLVTIVVAGHDIPNTSLKKHDGVKHPESFINHDRGYLVPGVGRGIKPKFKNGFNPFTYNPVTGSNDGGIGGHVPRFGRVGVGSFMPGGDETFVPKPGFEVPTPGTGSTAPGPIMSHLSGFSRQATMLDAKQELVSRLLAVEETEEQERIIEQSIQKRGGEMTRIVGEGKGEANLGARKAIICPSHF